ncbi:R15P isomerase [Intoshia linei]|uniref:Translation initiation factor eIF2B subunit alpha n=1 Tax=Intoshia linei TaxID=1819745 RepID=A0A177BA93_9BILA|nr:R15P isomerase [Intoshia linei]
MKIVQSVINQFENLKITEKFVPDAIHAINILNKLIKDDESTTIYELLDNIKNAITAIISESKTVSTSSCTELFMGYITLKTLDQSDISKSKQILLDRALKFSFKLSKQIDTISQFCYKYLINKNCILIMSMSKGFTPLMKKIIENNDPIIYVLCDSSESIKYITKDDLPLSNRIKLISFAEIGRVLGTVDVILTESQAIVESGGIIGNVGTFTTALCAKQFKIPIYICSESYKFVRFCPIRQSCIDTYLESLMEEKSKLDYTPPNYIDLIFTDIGVLTPYAAANELIKIYL